MRVLEGNVLTQIYCNQCGKKMKIENEIVMEGILHVENKWDYFSGKDGMQSSFDLCEQCYEKIIKGFIYPVEEQEYKEFL